MKSGQPFPFPVRVAIGVGTFSFGVSYGALLTMVSVTRLPREIASALREPIVHWRTHNQTHGLAGIEARLNEGRAIIVGLSNGVSAHTRYVKDSLEDPKKFVRAGIKTCLRG